MYDFDIIVIGAGPGGYTAAVRAAAQGKRVAVFERDLIGGTCLNRGCIPTKSLLHSSLQLQTSGAEKADLNIFEVSAATQKQLRDGISALFAKNKITLISESAYISSERTVEAGGKLYTAESIIVACGTRPARLNISGAAEHAVTSDDLLTGKAYVQNSITIVGGGVIGCEIANLYLNLGKSVTIVEMANRILPQIDRDMSLGAAAQLKKSGCVINTSSRTIRIFEESGQYVTEIEKDGKLSQAYSDTVLVATGRSPMSDDLFSPGLIKTERGYIVTDTNHKTSCDSIFAIGDIELGAIQLAHYAEAAGKNVADILCGKQPQINTELVPSCVYLSQEIASVGHTAESATAAGISVYTKKSLSLSNAKALIELPERGFCKLIFESETEVLVGAQLMCPHASEFIGLICCLINMSATEADIRNTVFPHPTVSEIILSAVE